MFGSDGSGRPCRASFNSGRSDASSVSTDAGVAQVAQRAAQEEQHPVPLRDPARIAQRPADRVFRLRAVAPRRPRGSAARTCASRQTSDRICAARLSGAGVPAQAPKVVLTACFRSSAGLGLRIAQQGQAGLDQFVAAAAAAEDAADQRLVIVVLREQGPVGIGRHRADQVRHDGRRARRADRVQRLDDPGVQRAAVAGIQRRVVAVPADVVPVVLQLAEGVDQGRLGLGRADPAQGLDRRLGQVQVAGLAARCCWPGSSRSSGTRAGVLQVAERPGGLLQRARIQRRVGREGEAVGAVVVHEGADRGSCPSRRATNCRRAPPGPRRRRCAPGRRSPGAATARSATGDPRDQRLLDRVPASSPGTRPARRRPAALRSAGGANGWNGSAWPVRFSRATAAAWATTGSSSSSASSSGGTLSRVPQAARARAAADAHFAAVVLQPLGQGRRGGAVAEQAQPLRRRDLAAPRRRRGVARSARRSPAGRWSSGPARAGVQVERGRLAEPLELQVHHAGDARVVAAEAMRPAPGRAASPAGPAGPATAGCRGDGVALARMVAAEARPPLARPHVDPRHLVQLRAALGVHRLQGQRHVGRDFDRERAVRRERHRAQFDRLVAGVDDVRVRRARGQRPARRARGWPGPAPSRPWSCA